MNTYDENAMGECIALLVEEPQTVPQLAARFERSERTIKRWMSEMRERGHRVVREGVDVDSPYVIVD